MSEERVPYGRRDSWHSYPDIFNIGHAAVDGLLSAEVIVEEKIDGSQFSWSAWPDLAQDGLPRLRIRSKGAEMYPEAPEKMFAKAVDTVRDLFLRNLLPIGVTYRAEFLAKPKHNALAYDRVPAGHLMVFDVNPAEEEYLSPDQKASEASRLGLECVPVLHRGRIESLELFRALLETRSVLGGQPIEGVVVKPVVPIFGRDKKCLMAKFVSERFKEVHAQAWKVSNPTAGDFIQSLMGKYTTAARWQKATQHLRDAGQLEHSPRDIGLLIREVPLDVEKECAEEIKDALYAHFWPKIRRGLTAGLPDWYKNELLRSAFEQSDSPELAGGAGGGTGPEEG